MFPLIQQSLSGFGNFSQDQLHQIMSRLKKVAVKKNEPIIREGQVCRDFYFIESGSCRQYRVLDDGTDVTLNLWLEGDWVFDYKSFISQAGATAVTEATEAAAIFVLGGADFHELIKISDVFFRIGKIFEVAISNQEFQQKKMSPEKKYRQLLTTRPGIIRRFPLKYIASYLDMTPETISRVRRKIVS